MGRGRIALVVAVVLVAIVAVVQIVLPGLAAGNVEDRLTEDGGTADASVSAFPAVRLLWGSGDKLEVTGSGLRFDIEDRIQDPLDKLAKFGEVDIRLTEVTAEPVAVSVFELRRAEGEDPFELLIRGRATPGDLAAEMGRETGGALGGLLGSIGGTFLGGSEPLPLEIDGRVVRNDDGTINVDAADASLGGVPAGPFAALVVQTVLDRL